MAQRTAPLDWRRSTPYAHLYVLPCMSATRSSAVLTFMLVQGQGGGQAIEDGAALGILLDQFHDKQALESRLQMFEQVRRGRGSALQVLSSINPPAPQSYRDAAAEFLPDGMRLDSTDEINDYVFSHDVVKESRAVLAAA
jgi:salicylate hydroxylase